MKNKMIRILAAVALIALAMSLAACANGNIYDKLADDGYTVKVRFDAGGAFVNDTQNVTIVEVFNKDDVVTTSAGKTGIAILAPDDPIRGEDKITLSKNDGTCLYFPIGWYRERTPVVDVNGNPLDVFGVPVSESKREQAYTYSGKWDFDKDVIDPAELTDGELILYAAWAPSFTYEFYSQNEAGVFEKIGSKQKITLEIPTVSASGKINMKDFPKVDGKVFASAYLNESLTEEISENLDGRTRFVDFEKGIATTHVVKVYITWSQEQESVA
ncbi:MAG: hypothetical protein E7584_08480 [Ruminococcaceae bacterium]|nr:hypothetical protein [Oscillospiraceae bacterium]